MFPKIDRHCPYVDRLASVMDGDFCRMCKRTVTDLDTMAAGERRDFLAGCETEVCVKYALRPALAAAALAASVATLPAAAQDAPAPQPAAPADDSASEDVAIVLAGTLYPRSQYYLTSAVPVTVVTVADQELETPFERNQHGAWRWRDR